MTQRPGARAGDWFCSEGCRGIHERLLARVAAGKQALAEGSEYSWRLLHGRDGTQATAADLRATLNILQVSADIFTRLVSSMFSRRH